jgi:hypothetical protein
VKDAIMVVIRSSACHGLWRPLQAGVRQTLPCRCGNGLKKERGYSKKGEPTPFSSGFDEGLGDAVLQ